MSPPHQGARSVRLPRPGGNQAEARRHRAFLQGAAAGVHRRPQLALGPASAAREINSILDQTFDLILAAQERSRKRLARRRAAGEFSTVFSINHFETGGSVRRG